MDTTRSFGIGIDLVEIESLRKVVQRHPKRFALRILTPIEHQLYSTHAQPLFFLAGRFCAKEAVLKAIGFGFKKQGSCFSLIEILPDEFGQPKLRLLPNLEQNFQSSILQQREWSLSISHHKSYATAVAMWMQNSWEATDFKKYAP